jgi:hypothetical protein
VSILAPHFDFGVLGRVFFLSSIERNDLSSRVWANNDTGMDNKYTRMTFNT